MGGISIWQILIILGVVLLIFGSGKLRNVGTDLGAAIKGFKKEMAKPNSRDSELAILNQDGKDSEKGQF